MKPSALLIVLCAASYAFVARRAEGVPTMLGERVVEALEGAAPYPVSAKRTLPGGSEFAVEVPLPPASAEPAIRIPRIDKSEIVRRSVGLAVSSPFGWRLDPIRGSRHRHNGIDLPGPSGTSVFATGAGVVRIAAWVNGYGNLVEISHPGGLTTRYGHLSRIRVARGTTVGHGQIIGDMGSTGRSTGPHLHYEVRIGGAPVDPFNFSNQTSDQYRISWARDIVVTPKWSGWTIRGTADRLPEAEIR